VAQKAILATAYLEFYRKEAKERQGTRTDLKKKNFQKMFSGSQARDQAGQLLGASGRSVEKAAKIKAG